MDDSAISTVTRTALRMADPTKGNHLQAGLAMLERAEQCVNPGSQQAMAITGLKGIILLWHNRLPEAAATLRRAGEEAGRLGHFVLRRWLFEWHIQARDCDKRAQASAA